MHRYSHFEIFVNDVSKYKCTHSQGFFCMIHTELNWIELNTKWICHFDSTKCIYVSIFDIQMHNFFFTYRFFFFFFYFLWYFWMQINLNFMLKTIKICVGFCTHSGTRSPFRISFSSSFLSALLCFFCLSLFRFVSLRIYVYLQRNMSSNKSQLLLTLLLLQKHKVTI